MEGLAGARRSAAGLSDIRFSLEPISSVERAGAVWRRLEQGAGNPFFVSWLWIGTWLRCLPSHVRSQLLIAERGDQPVAAAILVQRPSRRHGIFKHQQLHFNSTGDPALDCIVIEHNGFVAAGEDRHRIWPEFLRWFRREASAHELCVPGIEQGAIGNLENTGLLHGVRQSPAFSATLTEAGREGLLARLSRNARQQLRRSLRACEALGELRIDRAQSAPVAQQWFGELKALHVSHWTRRGQRHAFHYPFFETFHRALIDAGVEKGQIVLRRVSAGSAVLGYLYDFRHGEHVYAYQSGFDDSWARLRPGYVAHALAMEQSARRGAREYDFLAGENRLKRSFGNRLYGVVSHVFRRPTALLRFEAAALRLSRRCGQSGKMARTVKAGS